MTRAILISIRPEWAAKIVTGEKTVEIRKTKPNLEPPFRCYIYLTKQRKPFTLRTNWGASGKRYDGHVIAEFTCTHIGEIKPIEHDLFGIYDIDDDYVRKTCLVDGAMWDYGNGQTLYGWNISDVRIFNPLPMELDDFTGVRASGTWLERYKIQRAPQSWCYVEELKDGDRN